MCNRKAQTLISHINIKDQRIKLTITHRFHPRYQLMSFTHKYWSPHKNNLTLSHPLTVFLRLWAEREKKRYFANWKFFAEGTVSNSPFSYSIQEQLARHLRVWSRARLKNGPATGQGSWRCETSATQVSHLTLSLTDWSMWNNYKYI